MPKGPGFKPTPVESRTAPKPTLEMGKVTVQNAPKPTLEMGKVTVANAPKPKLEMGPVTVTNAPKSAPKQPQVAQKSAGGAVAASGVSGVRGVSRGAVDGDSPKPPRPITVHAEYAKPPRPARPITVHASYAPTTQAPSRPPQLAQKAMPTMQDQHNALTEKLARRAQGGGKRAARRAQLAAFGKGGETARPGVRSRDGAIGTISGAAVGRTLRDAYHGKNPAGSAVTRFGITTVASKPSKLSNQERERLRTKRMDRMAGKSLRVMTIADYYNAVVKADGPATPAPPTGAPKRFPRKEKPTIKMKPISDGEAMNNLKTGANKKEGATYNNYDKSIRIKLAAIKALTAGYNKVSGGGALMAANRGKLTVADLNRAMEAMPKPSSVKPPMTYLPGVHDPKSPTRARKNKKPLLASKALSTPGGVKRGVPRAPAPAPSRGSAKLAKPKYKPGPGGETNRMPSAPSVSKCDHDDSSSMEKPDLKKQKNVVHKSEGAAPMAKTNFNDLFKSELAVANEDALIDCPHCEVPITKSDIATANSKGKTMHGSGHGQVKSSRPGAGAQKTDAVVGVQNGKGSKARKSDFESDDDMDKSDDDAPIGAQRQAAPAQKQMQKGASFRGTDFVQYVDYGDAPGGDAYIAKSIAEAQGALGQQATQPMDLNNDLSRLLV